VAPLKRIPQKLTGFCEKNALQIFDLARFLIARHDSMRVESALEDSRAVRALARLSSACHKAKTNCKA
jgi:3-methyladenine DNA glycosylase Tag